MIKSSPVQPEPGDSSDEHVTQQTTGSGMPRKISVKACQGEAATVVVTVVHGTVRMSIVPPFTWEAIMEPGMVDEVVRVLTLARDEASRMAKTAHGRRAGRNGGMVARTGD